MIPAANIARSTERGSCLIRLLYVLVPVLIIAGVVVWFVERKVNEPIDLENATKADALEWLALRDLSRESPETRDKLFDMYFSNLEVRDSASNAPVKLELPKEVAQFSGVFMNGRDEKVREWERGWKRPPYLRLDYVVQPDPKRPGACVRSSDVVPGPALKERWDAALQASKKGRAPKRPTVEKNIQLLVLQWFTSKYQAYDATPDEQKGEKLSRTVDELLLFQDFYNNVRKSAKQPDLTRAEMLREFESTLDSWNGLATIDQVAKALWFKDLLEQAAADRMNVMPRLGGAVGMEPPKLRDPAKKPTSAQTLETVGTGLNTALDAIRDYVFEKREP